jgi:hypothetical protein
MGADSWRYYLKHDIVSYDSSYHQCHEDEDQEQSEKAMESLRRPQQKGEPQGQSRLILAKLQEATPAKETTRQIVQRSSPSSVKGNRLGIL